METIEELKKQGYKLSNFYKKQDSDKVYWIASDHIGEHMFSFDKKLFTTYSLIILIISQKNKWKYLTKKISIGQISSVAESNNRVDKKYSIHPIITLGRVDIQFFGKLMRETCKAWYNSIPLQ